MKRQRFRFKLAALLLIGLLALAGVYGLHSVEEYGTRLMQAEEAAETAEAPVPEASPASAADPPVPEAAQTQPPEAPSPGPAGETTEPAEDDDSGWRRIHSPSSGE